MDMRNDASPIARPDSARAAAAQQASAEFLTFRLGGEEYGIDILRVQEIRSYEEPTRIANAPSFIKGVVNLRGVIVPIVDLRLKLGCDTAEYNGFTVVIVINVRGRVVGRECSLVSQALLAGIVGGFGRGFSANANGIFTGQVGANGQREALSPTDILAGGIGQGAGEAADTVSRYLIDRAEQYQPVVEMPTGIEVEIVFLDGVHVRSTQQ